MITWGARSARVLAELHPELQRLLAAYAASATVALDIILTDGYRDEAAQNAAFAAGKSKKRWPDSAHNQRPARAVDFCASGPTSPYDRVAMLLRQGAVRMVAAQVGVALKPLIVWDLPHVELADAP